MLWQCGKITITFRCFSFCLLLTDKFLSGIIIIPMMYIWSFFFFRLEAVYHFPYSQPYACGMMSHSYNTVLQMKPATLFPLNILFSKWQFCKKTINEIVFQLNCLFKIKKNSIGKTQVGKFHLLECVLYVLWVDFVSSAMHH